MRLICPNCGAQYEVAEDVISDVGRDVQCSNCGHTWFEQPGASVRAEDEATVPAPVQAEPEAAPEPEPEPEPEPAPEPTRQRRDLDPGVADILRQEAEYERTARQAEADPLESQPDLDLSHDPVETAQDDAPTTAEDVDPEEDRRSREARDRLARLRGEAEVAPSSAASAVTATMAREAEAPRRDLLPDIEEINSTLRHDGGGSASTHYDEEDDDAPRKSGFRRGVVLAVLLGLVALAIYVFAPQITAALPQAEPVLTAYVEWVNDLRLWLDGQVQGLLAGGAGSEAAAAD